MAETALRKAKSTQPIRCDKCGAVGVLVDSRTEARESILSWHCGYCGDTWYTRNPELTAYADS